MILERHAPAKINLGLHVLRRRPDGYHDIETVFLRIPWYDTVRARPADTLTFTCSDPSLPVDEENLCVQAARRLTACAGVQRGAALHLEKRLPYGAGLGSGSSDAAATLLLLRDLWALDVPDTELARLAADLGSDVPFFLDGPAAYATGRGERLEPLVDPTTGAPYACPFHVVVVAPAVHVSTADAYRAVTPSAAGRPDLKALVCSNDLARWRTALVNDFEAVAFSMHPELAQIKRTLLDAGAGYAALSGSGAALFGLFEDPESTRRMTSVEFRVSSVECRVWCEP